MSNEIKAPHPQKRSTGVTFYVTWAQLAALSLIILTPLIVALGLFIFSQPATVETQTVLVVTPTFETPPQRFTTAGTTTVRIDAAQGWQPAGIRLEQGQPFRIQYLLGKWSITPAENRWYGPDGGAHACGQPDCVEPIPGYSKSGLIGRMGEGDPFPIGNYLETTADATGVLYLRVNDIGTDDNEGIITLQISIGAP